MWRGGYGVLSMRGGGLFLARLCAMAFMVFTMSDWYLGAYLRFTGQLVKEMR